MTENSSRRLGVREIGSDDRRFLEHLLGQPLQEDQEVYILAFKPGVVPDEATRRGAHASMQETFARAQRRAQQQGIIDAEIDEAVDEATDHVRYGNG